MPAKSSPSSATPDREIILTRLLDAPHQRVWDAWTDPAQVTQWWGPQGFTTTIHHMDVRPGGHWRYIMHGPDGADYPNLVKYIEVVKPRLLVYDHGSGQDPDPHSFRVTITFDDDAGKTRLTMRSLFPTPAARDFVIREFHAIQGGNQTLDRLEEHLSKPRARRESI
jgi:uncharacterized protein YndB with AHSA1/START domain